MKSRIAQADLAYELARRGFITAHAEPAPDAGGDRPWFVSAVLGVAGWLAGVFALIFVWLLFRPDTASGAGLAGAVLLAAAFGLYFADRGSAFFDQLALALSIAGQFALVAAAALATESWPAAAALTALLQGVLLLTLPNAFAKTLAAFFFCAAWALTLRFAWWGENTFGGDRAQVALLPALAGWLVIWIPVAVAAHELILREPLWMAKRWRAVARPGLAGALLALSVATWVSEPFGSLMFFGPPGEAYTNWLVLWPLLATVAALFAATCAYRLRDRALVGVAIAGALLHVIQFYYLLGTTLLVKSGIMLGLGVALLLGARWLRQRAALAGGVAQ